MINLKGIWIPMEILCDENLTDTEQKILALIIFLYNKGNGFYCNNDTLSKIFKKSKRQISRVVNNLETKKYVKIEMKYKNNSKCVENRMIIPKSMDIDDHRCVDIDDHRCMDINVYDNKIYNNKRIKNKYTNLSDYRKSFENDSQFSIDILESLYEN